jgi:hypothetical protein
MNNAENLLKHVETLCVNYERFTGRDLIDAATDAADLIQRMAEAPFAVVSHGTQVDPVFNYANNRALELFEMTWEEFTMLPSRLSAEAPDQAERARLLEKVSRQGYVDDYSGVRISKSGRKFIIRNATVWNLYDAHGNYYGQAALIRDWEP